MQHSTLPEQKLETSTLKDSATIVQLQTLLRLERDRLFKGGFNQHTYRKIIFKNLPLQSSRAVTNPTVKPDRRYKSCLSSRRLVNPCFCYAREQSIFTLAARYVYALVC